MHTADASSGRVVAAWPERAGVGGGQWLLRLAPVLLVVAPFTVLAGQAFTLAGHLMFAGDQALIGLDVHDAARLQQLVGPYSRYGWAHPGPIWFYLLAPVQQLGGDSAALVAAGAVVNALVAAALVLVVAERSAVLAWVAAALVLGLVLRLPAEFFVNPWNPFALLLPTALLLVVGGAAMATGRPAKLLWATVVGSFLVETHIGTLPLVGLVLAVSAAGTGYRSRRGDGPRVPRRHYAFPAAVLVLVWVPPIAQQLTGPLRHGNLSRLAYFVLHPSGEVAAPPLGASVAAVARVLAMAPLGWGPGPLDVSQATVPGTALMVLVAQVAAAAGLVVAGWRCGLGRPAAVGTLVLVALAAGVLAARTASGPLFWYLIVWVCVLPLSTALGYSALVVALVDRRLLTPNLRRGVLVATAVSVVALSGGTSLSLDHGVATVPDSPGVHGAVQLADPAVGERPTLTVQLTTHDLWPVAAGLVDELVSQGHQVLVGPSLAVLMGSDRLANPPVGPVLMLTAPGTPSDGRLLGLFDTELGPAALYLLPPAPT
jgi:hypothetical protein